MTDTSNNSNTPYANLNPHLILDAIENTGLLCSGSLLALNSYENRVYQVGIENEAPLIAKFYRPNRWSNEAILEEHQFAHELMQHEIPVVAPMIIKEKTLHDFKNFRYALFPRRGGRPLELDNLDQLAWMGRFIGRLHAVGACQSFKNRSRLDAKTHGRDPFHFLIKHNFIPDFLKEKYIETVTLLLNLIDEAFLKAGVLDYIRLHGDCHAGNVLWNEVGPHIVDLDDSIMGPAIQDIWMLLSGDRQQVNLQLSLILEGYREFHDFNVREIYLIEALRALRLIQYSAWLANRWNDPAFPLAFPWFNTAHYWQEQLQDLNDQINSLMSAENEMINTLNCL